MYFYDPCQARVAKYLLQPQLIKLSSIKSQMIPLARVWLLHLNSVKQILKSNFWVFKRNTFIYFLSLSGMKS